MIIEPIDDLLSIAVPNNCRHIVRAARKDVCMIWAELYFLDWQCVGRQHHYRLLSSAPQVPHFDGKVGGACRYEVLILVEVHRKYFV